MSKERIACDFQEEQTASTKAQRRKTAGPTQGSTGSGIWLTGRVQAGRGQECDRR